MTKLDFFTLDFDKEHFENHSNQNGFVYWYASELKDILGYKTDVSFNKSINKAISVCTTLNINILDNFIQEQRNLNGKVFIDYKLSRFACYLVVMNCDTKMPIVSQAQVYFATLAGAIQDYISETQNIERVIIREEISNHEKILHGIVNNAGVENYPFFQNAGYRGMYNMNIKDLKNIRGVGERQSLLDFMGGTELAANLFRITQTEERIKQKNIKGQNNLEYTHNEMGKIVRQTMQKMSGILPENLPQNEDIKDVKKELKQKNKKFKEIDKSKK